MKKLAIATMACGVLFTTACSKPADNNEQPEQTEQSTPEQQTVSMDSIGMAIKEAMVNYWNEESLQLTDGMIPGWEELTLQDELTTGMYPMFMDLNAEGTLFVPMINVKSDMIVVAKATDGNIEAIKSAFEQVKEDQVTQWSQYLPEQYEKVKANKIVTSGDYVLYVTFDDTDVIEKAFLDTVSGK